MRAAEADQSLASDDEESPRPSERSRPLRTLALVAIVSFVGLWGYVLYLAFFEGRQPPADRLDDPAFAVAAEERCDDALSQVDELPSATSTATPQERAVVLDEANEIYDSMLGDLEGLTHLVTDSDERERTEAWLADWRIFLGDREDFADRLSEGTDSRMLVSEKEGEGRHITGWVDEFALANKMDSCISASDA